MTLTRANAPVESTWKRETTFPSWDEWDKQFQLAKGSLHELREMKGKITENPEVLARWFELYEVHAVRIYELQGFVSWASNVDSSDPEANSRQGLVAGLLAEFQAAVSFAEPEMIAAGEKILEWVKESSPPEAARAGLRPAPTEAKETPGSAGSPAPFKGKGQGKGLLRGRGKGLVSRNTDIIWKTCCVCSSTRAAPKSKKSWAWRTTRSTWSTAFTAN